MVMLPLCSEHSSRQSEIKWSNRGQGAGLGSFTARAVRSGCRTRRPFLISMACKRAAHLEAGSRLGQGPWLSHAWLVEPVITLRQQPCLNWQD